MGKTELRPQEAARFVLDDIKNDPVKLETFQEVSKFGENFYVGNRIFHEVYGTSMSEEMNSVFDSFEEKVYQPLDFVVVGKPPKEMLPEDWMLYHMGKLAKQP